MPARTVFIGCQPLVVQIILYGVLGARFGREHRLAVHSRAEPIRIAPIVLGRKAGLFQTIAGIALIVVGAITSSTTSSQRVQAWPLVGWRLCFLHLPQAYLGRKTQATKPVTDADPC